MKLPNFWRLVGAKKVEPADLITPDIPNLDKAIKDPNVLSQIQFWVDIIIKGKTELGMEFDYEEELKKCLFNVIQSYGAQLSIAMDNNDLDAASEIVNKLAKLMNACGGGTICPIHEPVLLAYLKAMSERK